MGKEYQLQKEFAEKWLAALRNTSEDLHTTGVLHEVIDNTNCYCANGLGYCKNGYEVEDSRVRIDEKWMSGYNSKLPIPYDLFEAIVCLNDAKGKSFSEIADWIEENVEFI